MSLERKISGHNTEILSAYVAGIIGRPDQKMAKETEVIHFPCSLYMWILLKFAVLGIWFFFFSHFQIYFFSIFNNPCSIFYCALVVPEKIVSWRSAKEETSEAASGLRQIIDFS